MAGRRRSGGMIKDAVWFVIALCIIIAVWNEYGRTPAAIAGHLKAESQKFEHWIDGLVGHAETHLPKTPPKDDLGTDPASPSNAPSDTSPSPSAAASGSTASN